MTTEQRQSGVLLMHGVVGGIIAGIFFIAAQMLASVMLGGTIVDPLRLIGSMVLGSEAVSPTYPVGTTLAVSSVLHVMLSAIYGVIFVYLLAYTRQLTVPPILLLVYGSAFGFALWILNFLIIASIVWPQFLMLNQFWNGFVAHTFFYGTVIGAYVATVAETITSKPKPRRTRM